MAEAWIHLECPSCLEVWESTLNALPKLGIDFECPYCEAAHPVAEFVTTDSGEQAIEDHEHWLNQYR